MDMVLDYYESDTVCVAHVSSLSLFGVINIIQYASARAHKTDNKEEQKIILFTLYCHYMPLMSENEWMEISGIGFHWDYYTQKHEQKKPSERARVCERMMMESIKSYYNK